MTQAPLPLPIRVLVKGASTVHTVSFMGGPRSEFAYPRAMEAALLARGQAADVRTTAVASQRTKTALKNWEGEIFSWSPDVVVLNYGHFETVHLFLPQRLERHANSLAARPGRIRSPYRLVLRKFWKALASVQQRLDRALPSTMFASRPRRVADDLVLLVERIQMIGSPLVVIMDLTPPGQRFRKWFPGMAERTEVMNAALADVVRRADLPNVLHFRTNDFLVDFVQSGQEVCPDGGHYTPEAHQAIGRALTDLILDWAKTQPHLRPGPAPMPEPSDHRASTV